MGQKVMENYSVFIRIAPKTNGKLVQWLRFTMATCAVCSFTGLSQPIVVWYDEFLLNDATFQFIPPCNNNIGTAFIFVPVVETGTINPNVLLELFSVYRDWQEKKTQKISERQVEEMSFLSYFPLGQRHGDGFWNTCFSYMCDLFYKISTNFCVADLKFCVWIWQLLDASFVS